MEHASALSPLPSFEDLRIGQRAIVEKFLDAAFGSSPSVIAKLPTGYGKTRAAAASFAALRNRGMVDFVLVIVPSGAQAIQAAEDVPSSLEGYGIHTLACDVGVNPHLAARALRANTAHVFVVTIQWLLHARNIGFVLTEMMSKGRWMVVADEYHHYGEDASWTERLLALPRSAFLAMSATPDRKGEPPTFGPPDVSVTYLSAVKEGAVKPLELHSYDYRLECINTGGQTFSFTTYELQEKAQAKTPEDIERYMALNNMRWSPKFISPLILSPVERLIELKATRGVSAQLLVQSLCCSHAKAVCEQISSLVPDGMTVDWVGTGPHGRDPAVNKDVLDRFCPKKKNGVRDWKLHVLVNVGMAGEGLDTTDCTDVVFLTDCNGTNKDLQTIGRIARRMSASNARDIVGRIHVHDGSPMAALVGRAVMRAFDNESDLPPATEDREPQAERSEREYVPISRDPIVALLNCELVEIKKNPLFAAVFEKTVAEDMASHPESDEERIRALVEKNVAEIFQARDERFSLTYRIAQVRRDINAKTYHVCRLARDVLGVRMKARLERSAYDLLVKKVFQKKADLCGNVAKCDGDGLQRHQDWLLELEATLMKGDVPVWLR